MYTMFMLRINIYIPEDLNRRLSLTARYHRKAKAEIVREALASGLTTMQPKSVSAKALLDFAKRAEALLTRGNMPKAFVKNMHFYTWGGTKRE